MMPGKKKSNGYVKVTEPPGGIVAVGTKERIAETPAVPATRYLSSMTKETLLTIEKFEIMPEGTHTEGVVSAEVET